MIKQLLIISVTVVMASLVSIAGTLGFLHYQELQAKEARMWWQNGAPSAGCSTDVCDFDFESKRTTPGSGRGGWGRRTIHVQYRASDVPVVSLTLSGRNMFEDDGNFPDREVEDLILIRDHVLEMHGLIGTSPADPEAVMTTLEEFYHEIQVTIPVTALSRRDFYRLRDEIYAMM